MYGDCFLELESLDGERWRQIVIDEEVTQYFISSKGRAASANGHKLSILRPQDNGTGYRQIALCRNGQKKEYYIHRLMGMMFLPNPEGKAQIDHINNLRADNRLENLQWVTAKENIALRDQRKELNTDGKTQ